jgi:hypothetical protein
MVLPRHLLSAALISTAALATPTAAHAGALNSVLGPNLAKLTNPSTSLIGPNLKTTLANVGAALHPVEDASCAAQPTTKPFSAWADRADYVPAPSGDFEDGLTDWTPTGNVTVADDNEPWQVSGNTDDTTAVTLAPGASIASNSFCGGAAYPTVRLFAKATSGTNATALVTIRYTGRDGLLGALPLGIITAHSTWQPTATSLTASGIPLITGTRLGLTITALSGTLTLDDIYVDPLRRS